MSPWILSSDPGSRSAVHTSSGQLSLFQTLLGDILKLWQRWHTFLDARFTKLKTLNVSVSWGDFLLQKIFLWIKLCLYGFREELSNLSPLFSPASGCLSVQKRLLSAGPQGYWCNSFSSGCSSTELPTINLLSHPGTKLTVYESITSIFNIILSSSDLKGFLV